MCSRVPRHKTAKKKPSTLTLENASHFLAKVLRSFRHANSKNAARFPRYRASPYIARLSSKMLRISSLRCCAPGTSNVTESCRLGKCWRISRVTGLRPISKREDLRSTTCKHVSTLGLLFLLHDSAYAYIIPPIPPAGIAGAGVSSLISATADSVVRKVDATDVAFCSALLVTFTGSRMPADTISTYLSFRAS